VNHRPIKRFEQSGDIHDDKYFNRVRLDNIRFLVTIMRNRGYVPVFDLEPLFSTHWTGNHYTFRLSVYGVYVGRKKAEWVAGVTGNKLVPFTHHNKSIKHSEKQVSE
jgi:hypothetical protein